MNLTESPALSDAYENVKPTYPSAPSVPPSWDGPATWEDQIIKGLSLRSDNNLEDLDTKLSAALHAISKNIAAKSIALTVSSGREKLLTAAVDEKGAWNLRSTVGSWRSKALTDDPAMKAEYKALGKA